MCCSYVDCPADLTTGTTTLLNLDNDLHFIVFVNMDDPTGDEEYWFSDDPPQSITLPIKQLQTPPSSLSFECHRAPLKPLRSPFMTKMLSGLQFVLAHVDALHRIVFPTL